MKWFGQTTGTDCSTKVPRLNREMGIEGRDVDGSHVCDLRTWQFSNTT